ncbi:MAG: four helix bundle protein [Candidatus Azotimanducaceae bacterium]|jgi:four helix bundle protein
MSILCFEDVISWKKSQDLAVEIYQCFSELKDYGFKDQICRAVVSISNNIAEGFNRKSNADFSRFLYYSLSSNSETQSMLYLSERLGYLKPKYAENLRNESKEISRIITGLIKSLK